MENKNLLVRWSAPNLPNWGDALNPVLLKKISGKNIVYHHQQVEKHYICIGSILQWSNEKTTVWGAGFIGEDRRLKTKPHKICAVRGPLSREIILNQGMECPEIYGDPALLYPRYYFPNVKKKYKLGIIPHYIDKDNNFIKNLKGPDVLIINILDPINKVIDDILSCEKIAASSLHGIIAADAYGVPSTWIEFSNKVIGNGFKFRDYYMSVNREIEKSLFINKNTSVKNIMERFNDYKIDIDLDKLYDACPFKAL